MSSSGNSPARSGNLLYLREGGGGLQSLGPPSSCLTVSGQLTVVNNHHLVIGSCHRCRAATTGGTNSGATSSTRRGGAEILDSRDLEAEVVSVISGAGLVLELPGFAIRQPQVHCKRGVALVIRLKYQIFKSKHY